MSAGLFNAFGRDLPIRVAMARTRDTPGYSSDTLQRARRFQAARCGRWPT